MTLDNISSEQIGDRILYLDTVQTLLRRLPPKGFMARLEALCGIGVPSEDDERNVFLEPTLKKDKNQKVKATTNYWKTLWPWRLRLQRPSGEALRLVDELTGGDHLINRFDVPLDIFPSGHGTVEQLYQYAIRSIIQKHRGKRQCYSEDHGMAMYWARDKWANRNIVAYYDRLSKITREACLHLEFRYRRSGPCRRLVNGALERERDTQISCTDLLDVDWLSVFLSQVKFVRIDEQRLRKLIEREALRGLRAKKRPAWIDREKAEMGMSSLEVMQDVLEGWVARVIRPSGYQLTSENLHEGIAQELVDRCEWAREAVVEIEENGGIFDQLPLFNVTNRPFSK